MLHSEDDGPALLPFPTKPVPPTDRIALSVPPSDDDQVVSLDIYDPTEAASVRVRHDQTAFRLANGGLMVFWIPNHPRELTRLPAAPRA